MRQVDFEHGSVGRNMLQSAVPMLVAQLFALLAAAKSFQSCPSLCDPMDGSPPGPAVPGVL